MLKVSNAPDVPNVFDVFKMPKCGEFIIFPLKYLKLAWDMLYSRIVDEYRTKHNMYTKERIMNILAIVGSPRKGKATDTLIDKTIEGVTSQHPNSQVKKIQRSELL